MNFSGWQRVSLVDYPKTISTVVFTSKCNFDCAYCHNPSLKTAQPATHSEAAILEYLARRHKQIDALVISGGEPSLRAEEIIGFCHRLKTALPNLLIKVDTNGSNPLFLQEGRDVFDYVAMDVKSLHYDRFSTTPFDTILQSLDLLDSYPRHEVRVTVYPPYLPETDFEELGRLLKDKRVRHVTLQQYRPVDDIPPLSGGNPPHLRDPPTNPRPRNLLKNLTPQGHRGVSAPSFRDSAIRFCICLEKQGSHRGHREHREKTGESSVEPASSRPVSEEELYTVINSLSGTLGNIQRQAAEQQQAAKNPNPEPTNESNTK